MHKKKIQNTQAVEAQIFAIAENVLRTEIVHSFKHPCCRYIFISIHGAVAFFLCCFAPTTSSNIAFETCMLFESIAQVSFVRANPLPQLKCMVIDAKSIYLWKYIQIKNLDIYCDGGKGRTCSKRMVGHWYTYRKIHLTYHGWKSIWSHFDFYQKAFHSTRSEHIWQMKMDLCYFYVMQFYRKFKAPIWYEYFYRSLQVKGFNFCSTVEQFRKKIVIKTNYIQQTLLQIDSNRTYSSRAKIKKKATLAFI